MNNNKKILYMFFAGVFAIEMYTMPSKWAAVSKKLIEFLF